MLKILLTSVLVFSSYSSLAACLQTPASFDDNRIYLKVQGPKESVLFYTDSGGVFPFVYKPTAEKLEMVLERTVEEEGMEFGLSTFPTNLESQNIPLHPEWKSNVRVFPLNEGGQDEPSQIQFFIKDGQLGASFFAAGKIWKFNYPKKELWYCDSLPSVEGAAVMDLHFKGEAEERETHQPRMEIEVLGTKIPMLFDTGATSFYSQEAVNQLLLVKQINPSSFIRESVAKKWLEKNPSWRVIVQGDKFGGAGFLIEVPKIKVAGIEVGPVWFATRKDVNYDHYSRTMMDSNIDGAVGGNVFKFFEIIADYPAGKLYFFSSPQSSLSPED